MVRSTERHRISPLNDESASWFQLDRAGAPAEIECSHSSALLPSRRHDWLQAGFPPLFDVTPTENPDL
jgi:hypothetical protein